MEPSVETVDDNTNVTFPLYTSECNNREVRSHFLKAHAPMSGNPLCLTPLVATTNPPLTDDEYNKKRKYFDFLRRNEDQLKKQKTPEVSEKEAREALATWLRWERANPPLSDDQKKYLNLKAEDMDGSKLLALMKKMGRDQVLAAEAWTLQRFYHSGGCTNLVVYGEMMANIMTTSDMMCDMFGQ